MKQKDIHDDWAEKSKRERNVSADQEQRATGNLKSSDKVEVMRLHHYSGVLACKPRRHRPHWDEMQETVQPKHKKDQAE